MKAAIARTVFIVLLAACASAQDPGRDRTLPPLKPQPTLLQVAEEHFAAFNACDWTRLMAQMSDNVEFFGPNGAAIQGRVALGKAFADVPKTPAQGGRCGLKLTIERTSIVGNTINVLWRAEAPFLTAPYRGTNVFETRDGLIAAEVTTFDGAALPMKK